jgi:hypothetical protein
MPVEKKKLVKGAIRPWKKITHMSTSLEMLAVGFYPV